MIDLHTHSFFSDGELIPAELIRRAQAKAYHGIAITDHADNSNLDFLIPRLVRFCRAANTGNDFRVVPGVELTHVPPDSIPSLVKEARNLGATLIVVHGETIVEPVSPGTNRSALEAGIDILAHPGLITEEEVLLAKEKGVFLEISTRKGHSLTNGHVANLAKKVGAPLLLNTDSHSPDDLVEAHQARRIAIGAGLTDDDWKEMSDNARRVLELALSRL
ncbi:MAG: histidinol phosphate phosphatase domain-containing protein [Deltaproteobacteria bacterium]|nr:histidinol phosphate phosphatase domain-containing protein [Deltaproteobacteria bacterium]